MAKKIKKKIEIFFSEILIEVVLKKHALNERCKTTAMGSRVGVESSSFFCWKEKNISRKKKIVYNTIALLNFSKKCNQKVLLNKVIYFFEQLKKVFTTCRIFCMLFKYVFALGKNPSV